MVTEGAVHAALENGFVDRISDEDFSLFAELIYTTAGIRLGANKKGLLVSRLTRRLNLLGLESFHKYYRLVRESEEELAELLTCVSTNTTKFFREQHHFHFLKDRVIPELLKSRAAGRVLRIWSAGCSSGEEPYSIAITSAEVFERTFGGSASAERSPSFFHGWDLRILATDISTRALGGAESGIFDYDALPEDLPQEIVSRYFLRGSDCNAGKVMVKDFVRGGVIFRRLNLKEEAYPFRRKFDVIFCRNVMIYFDEPMKQHVLGMFHTHLADDGYLFLGHSESMIGNGKFRPVHITTYRKT